MKTEEQNNGLSTAEKKQYHRHLILDQIGVQGQLKLKQAILLAKDSGAKGVTLFDGPELTDDYLSAIKETKESFK